MGTVDKKELTVSSFSIQYSEHFFFQYLELKILIDLLNQ